MNEHITTTNLHQLNHSSYCRMLTIKISFAYIFFLDFFLTQHKYRFTNIFQGTCNIISDYNSDYLGK